MFKKIFKKEKKENSDNKNILVASLLIHAAKIDENYTEIEKKIIKKAIIDLNEISPDEAEKMLELAEKKENRAIEAAVIDAQRVPPSAFNISQSTVKERGPNSSRFTTPRNDLAINRSISIVLPFAPCLSLRNLESVDPGISEYSALTQPRVASLGNNLGKLAAFVAQANTTVFPWR